MKKQINQLTKASLVIHPTEIWLEIGEKKETPEPCTIDRKNNKSPLTLRKAIELVENNWCYLDVINLRGIHAQTNFKEIILLLEYIQSKNKGIYVRVEMEIEAVPQSGYIRELLGKADLIQIHIHGFSAYHELMQSNNKFESLDHHLTLIALWCKGSKTRVGIMIDQEIVTEHQSEALLKYLQFRHIRDLCLKITHTEGQMGNKKSSFPKQLFSNQLIQQYQIRLNSFEVNFPIRNTGHPDKTNYVNSQGETPSCCQNRYPDTLMQDAEQGKDIRLILNQLKYKENRRKWAENQVHEACEDCENSTY